MNGTKTRIIADSINLIRSNPLSNPLSELITAHELIKMNESMILKYPSLETSLMLLAKVIESELE